MEHESSAQGDRATPLVLGSSLALALAAVDVLLGLRSSAQTGLAVLLPPVATTFASAALVYAVLWFGAGVPLRRSLGLATNALALGFAAAIAGFVIALLALQRMQLDLTPSVAVVVFNGALLFGAVVIVIASLVERSTSIGKTVRKLALAVACLAVLAAGAQWLRAPRGEDTLAAGDGKAPATRPAFAGKIQRVILIVVDTLRYDALSCDRPTHSPTDTPAGTDGTPPAGVETPAIDAFARESIRFEQARSPAPWTLPAMCSMLTGLAPAVHLAVSAESVLPKGVTTLAERLRAAGYRTAALGRNSFLHPRARLNRGFDEYSFYPRLWSGTPIGSAILDWFRDEPVPDEPLASDLTRLAGAWLETHRAEPFFLWLHYFDPHQPYEPPREYAPQGEPPYGMGRRFAVPISEVRAGHFTPDLEQRAWIRGLYDGEVRSVDASLARLFQNLKDLGLYDDSLIVLTSDHGEELWEHDSFEHGHSLYDELLRVPLIVKVPKVASRTDGHLVSTESVTPTILALCGVPSDPSESSSLALLDAAGEYAILSGQHVGSFVFAGGLLANENRTAVIVDDFKYIKRAITEREEVFNLKTDPAELDPTPVPGFDIEQPRVLLTIHLQHAAELRQKLGILKPDTTGLDEATQRDLRSMGYLGK
jgi:arylsulfatase A-like enzyme